jgi:hypothetical protein
MVAARGQVHALGRAQQELTPKNRVRDPVQRRRSSPSAVGSRRAPDDGVDPNQPLVMLDIEEYAIVADPLAELGRMVSQGQDVALRRVERELIQRAIEPTAIIQRKLPQIPSCAAREDQLPGHA